MVVTTRAKHTKFYLQTTINEKKKKVVLCNSSLFFSSSSLSLDTKTPSVVDNETQPHLVQPGKTDTEADLLRQVTCSHSANEQNNKDTPYYLM